jgi:DUF4097 and DUF4098 domain-containing protein YvlB
MEERMRILKLLEDGKITADEAARLLEAIGTSEGPKEEWRPGDIPRFVSKTVASELRRVPEIVSEALSGVMGEETARSFRFTGVKSLSMKAVSGDCAVRGGDRSEVLIRSQGGPIRTNQVQDEVQVRSLSGDLRLEVPSRIDIELTSVSGDLELENLEGELDLRTTSGDIRLERIKGRVEVNTVSGDLKGVEVSGWISATARHGDVAVSFSSPEGGEIRVEHGDIGLQVPENSDLILELSAPSGKIDYDLPKAKQLEAGTGWLKLGLGQSLYTLKATSHRGDITVKRG